MGCGTWIAWLATIRRLLMAHVREPFRRQAALAAGLLVTPLAVDHFCLGAFHILMLWLMTAGLARSARDRPWSGGLLLGLAIWLKLLPAVGAAYLLLKRKWLAAGIAATVALAVDAALSVAAFGPREAWELHRQWWRDQARDTAGRLLSDPERVPEDRPSNQSPAAVVRRVLSRLGYIPGDRRPQPVIADLTPAQLRAVYLGLLAALGTGVLIVCRRPGSRTSMAQWSVEIPLVVLATLWLSPVAWCYHFTAVTPALAVTLAGKPAHPRLCWAAAALWLASLFLLCFDAARCAGAMFWATLALAGMLLGSSLPGRSGGPPSNEPTR
jgi:hypothetical protein